LTKTLRLRAFAKINVGLKVLARRADGYHQLRTIYQTLALHDRLELSLATEGCGIEVTCDDPTIPAGRQNLVYQACQLWKQARKFRGGIRVHLEKRIPAGSGLGGGSSDAAATLLGLEHLTGDRLDAVTRFKFAARLGSDVPLFLYGGRVLGCGRGEQVYPLVDLPRRPCLVVFPGFAVSTVEAYQALDGERSATNLRLTGDEQAFSISSFGTRSSFPQETWGPAENDFEHVVFARWPGLARLKRRLIRAGAEIASLTGSGSAVYAVFPSARKLMGAWKQTPTGWLAFRTRTLPRREYQRLLFAD
jgi:4-diphosphocytidyl-2-C-methyl-D-erythritol kinase